MFINNLFFKLRELIAVSPAKRDRLIFVSLILSAVINIISWLMVPLFFWKFKDYVVLQYNIYFSISSLGPWVMLFFMPAFGLLVGVINYSLLFWLFLRQRILSYFLALSALFFQVIIFVALSLIIYMNM